MSVMIMIRQRQLSDDRRCIFSLVALLLLICLVTLSSDRHQVSSFHLSFSHRLLKSASNPQLNPASTLIRPIECRNANNQSEVGICMFSIDCMQNKGTPLSVCKHNYFVGTCCRLPDYNNFVGIVYDLRDTEGQLEVRRIPLDKLHQVTPDAAYTPTSVIPASPTTTAASSDLLLASSRAEPDQQSPVAQASSTVSSEEPLKDKYMVSSTSLFSTQTYPTTTLSDRAEGSGTGSEAHQVRVGETARNADGVVPQPLAVQQAAVFNGSKSNKLQQQQQSMVVVSSEQDSFQIHSDATMSTRLTSSSVTPVDLSPPPATLIQVPTSSHHHHQQQQQQVSVEDSSKQHSAYELIKDDNLDILATVNSVHSAPTTQQQQQQQQQQFNVITDHQDAAAASPPAKKVAQVAAADSSDLIGDSKPTPVQQSSVYLVDEQLQKQSNIVIANNHQYLSASGGSHASSTQQPLEVAQTQPTPSTSGLNLKVQSGQQPPSDQEFTLSSAPPAPSSTEDSHSTTEQRSTRPSSAAPEVLHINLTSSSSSSSSSSPFVDLVSNSNPSQSTTPFTTSLSTALLPNVSSHPYAPTAAPNSPVADISSLVSNKLAGQTSSRPHESGSLGLSQLYNGQQGSNSAGETVSGSQAPQSTSYLSRPNTNHMSGSGLQVASKIVTGSGSLPQNNNHIPGLSGLQSAILSHIPFKIASGLSSGLSSYLQAAMKPTGSRPLLSSNTAPSLQYQQQMQQQAANASKPQQVLVAASSGVRFPSTTGAAMPLSDAQPADEQQAANSSSLLAAVAAATGGSTSAEVLRDVVKEAQLVCGRPQVPAGGPTETKKRVARIVGGNQSLFGQWPWMVSLRQWRKGAFLHKCGAALLNENWAITAAHCVENVKVTDLLLRLGEFDVSNQNEPYPYIERRVKSVVSHPSFDPKTFEYDLALLRFAEPIKYERNIVPVCVPSGNDTYVDRMATVIGWGRLYEDGPLPDVIQHVDVPIITNNECEKMYKNAGYIEEIPDMFICAGISKGGRDSCEGDSGGPLTMIDYDGRSYLVGIISWGIGCALPSQPGVYTRITAFSGWINQITAF